MRGEMFEMGFYGNVVIRQITLSLVGDTWPNHAHPFPHVTFIGAGAVTIATKTPTGYASQKAYRAPSWIEIPAEAEHQIVATEPGTICYCVFAARDADGAVAEFVTEQHVLEREHYERSGFTGMTAMNVNGAKGWAG